MAFLRSLTGMGVRNIEMEAPAFSAYTREAGIRACIVCITFLDRLQGDQVRCAAYRWRCFKVFNVLGMFGRWRVSCEFAILIILNQKYFDLVHYFLCQLSVYKGPVQLDLGDNLQLPSISNLFH